MKYKHYVRAEDYPHEKRHYESMGLDTDSLTPVDMNYGYVPMKVTQKSKESSYNLQKTSECNLDRFGLNQK